MHPTEIHLFEKLRDQPTLITKILQLKIAGNTHQQIAVTLGYSKAYIDNVHSRAKREFDSINTN